VECVLVGEVCVSFDLHADQWVWQGAGRKVSRTTDNMAAIWCLRDR